jgi:hypothetical protein
MSKCWTASIGKRVGEARQAEGPMVKTIFAVLATLAMLVTVAFANACDDFNLTRFEPSELEHCIHDLQFNALIESKTKDSEIKLLQLQTCNLALALAQLKPMPADELQSYCFANDLKAKQSPAPKAK